MVALVPVVLLLWMGRREAGGHMGTAPTAGESIMIVKPIFVNGVRRSRGFEKRDVAKRGETCCQDSGRCWLCGDVRRRVSNRITFSGLVLKIVLKPAVYRMVPFVSFRVCT
tara:strand:- start:3651 stop:3983 length:333 start_codon:yes stop_codon:yes gene_type:complete